MLKFEVPDEVQIQEPPSFIVRCDGEDHWTALEVHGLCGGVFVNQAAAFKFVYEHIAGQNVAIGPVVTSAGGEAHHDKR